MFFFGVFFLFLVIGLSMPVSAAKRKRVILMKTMPVPVVNDHCKSFLVYLNRFGYRQGENLDLVSFDAKGDRNEAEQFLKSALLEIRPDMVVTSATLASQAAFKILRGTGIPQVFFTVSDPVGAGLIKTVGLPTHTNLTGKVHMINRQTRMDIVRRLIRGLPGKRPFRIGLIHSTYPSAIGDLRELRIIEKQLEDIEFISFPIEYQKVPEGLPAMLNMVRKTIKAQQGTVDFWWELSGPLGELPEYARLLITESKIPIIMGLTAESVELGALVHLTPGSDGTGREAAMLAVAILERNDPGTLPVTPPSSVDLGINLTTALRLGIVIPPDLLSLAGENIYR